MNRADAARAIARGVEFVLAQSFDESITALNAGTIVAPQLAQAIALPRISLSIEPIQLINDDDGKSVEFRISASDGQFEEVVYAYVRERLKVALWEVPTEDVYGDIEAELRKKPL
jgi:hypothetical protein